MPRTTASVLLSLFSWVAHAQAPPELVQTITKLDTALFDSYNKCRLAEFGALLTDDLEFYHDANGLSQGAAGTVEAVKNNICGKVHRELAPGTLSVFPLKNYGAVESGIHFFCDATKLASTGKCPDRSGVARFTHLWQYKDGKWKLARVISYDHCNDCSTSQPPEFRIAPEKHSEK